LKVSGFCQAKYYDGIGLKNQWPWKFTILTPGIFGTIAKIAYLLLLGLAVSMDYQYLKLEMAHSIFPQNKGSRNSKL